MSSFQMNLQTMNTIKFNNIQETLMKDLDQMKTIKNVIKPKEKIKESNFRVGGEYEDTTYNSKLNANNISLLDNSEIINFSEKKINEDSKYERLDTQRFSSGEVMKVEDTNSNSNSNNNNNHVDIKINTNDKNNEKSNNEKNDNNEIKESNNNNTNTNDSIIINENTVDSKIINSEIKNLDANVSDSNIQINDTNLMKDNLLNKNSTDNDINNTNNNVKENSLNQNKINTKEVNEVNEIKEVKVEIVKEDLIKAKFNENLNKFKNDFKNLPNFKNIFSNLSFETKENKLLKDITSNTIKDVEEISKNISKLEFEKALDQYNNVRILF